MDDRRGVTYSGRIWGVLRRRPSLWVASTVLLGAAAAILWHRPILVAVADFLTVQDTLRPADAILVLNGGVDTRPAEAARLYRQGLAPRVLVAEVEPSPAVAMGIYPRESDAAVQVFRSFGVPDSAIVVLPFPPVGVASTLDEATALARYAEAEGLGRAIVVSDARHLRRARWTMKQVMPRADVELAFAAAEDPRYHAGNWWLTETGLVHHVDEYLRLGYYLFTRRGGEIPWAP